MTIGKLSIGYRSADAYAWKKYLIPKYYISPKFKHHYFRFYIRWLNFYFCKPRKCDCCGRYLDGKGGTNFWDYDGNNYNTDFTTSSGLTTNSWGYVTDVAGTTESGFMNVKYGGSASTYFCDNGYLYSGRVLRFGGRWGYGSYCGPFYLYAFDTASYAGADVGARLMYL